jgi:hypothetical protein
MKSSNLDVETYERMPCCHCGIVGPEVRYGGISKGVFRMSCGWTSACLARARRKAFAVVDGGKQPAAETQLGLFPLHDAQ